MTVYDEIAAERERQDDEWGGPGHDDGHHVISWHSFINKQMELMLWPIYSAAQLGPNPGDIALIRERLLKIAALAVAGMEALDRTEGANVL